MKNLYLVNVDVESKKIVLIDAESEMVIDEFDIKNDNLSEFLNNFEDVILSDIAEVKN